MPVVERTWPTLIAGEVSSIIVEMALSQPTSVLSGRMLTTAIDHGLECLRRNFRSASGSAGWYHFLDDPAAGVTASAVGLFIFRVAGQRFERAEEVVRYLVGQQVKQGDERGGWAIRTMNGFPIVEATVWAVRALSLPGTGLLQATDALRMGAEYLERNQNTDFGWGSYGGQPSRVFHTALTMLALQECGGSTAVIDNGKKWLVGAQNSQAPAWGPLPGSEPTLLHTSLALMALVGIDNALSVNTIRDTTDWMMERLKPGQHVEDASAVEDFDVPYPENHGLPPYQNTLAHFAAPVAVTALLAAGVNPLQRKLFDVVSEFCESQRETGAWRLPRSPRRDSVWALWPFIAALAAMRRRLLPAHDSQAHLLFEGCAIIQRADDQRKVTPARLMWEWLMQTIRSSTLGFSLWAIAIVYTGVAVGLLLLAEAVDATTFLISLVLPTLLVVFQLVYKARPRGAKEGTQ